VGTRACLDMVSKRKSLNPGRPSRTSFTVVIVHSGSYRWDIIKVNLK